MRDTQQAGRLSLTAAALLPASVNLLQAPVAAAGSGAWLCPLLALPVGLVLCRTRWTGEGGHAVPRGIRAALCLAWGLVLLFFSAMSYSRRLLLGFNGVGNRALFLLLSVLLVLYLGRSGPALLREARLFLPAVAFALTVGLLLAFPAVRWENLDPTGSQKLGGFLGLLQGGVQLLSLSGYAVFVRFLPTERQTSPPAGETSAPESVSVAPFWVMGCCGVLTALLVTILGTFGSALVLRMDEPLVYLMGGAGLADGFRRGEAVLVLLVAVGDLALLALLTHGCIRLWESLFPRLEQWSPLPVVLAALAPLLFPEELPAVWGRVVLPVGNLLLAAVFTGLPTTSPQ